MVKLGKRGQGILLVLLSGLTVLVGATLSVVYDGGKHFSLSLFFVWMFIGSVSLTNLSTMLDNRWGKLLSCVAVLGFALWLIGTHIIVYNAYPYWLTGMEFVLSLSVFMAIPVVLEWGIRTLTNKVMESNSKK